MQLSDRCKDEFEPRTRSRGGDYQRQNRVMVDAADAYGLDAHVRGSSGRYAVSLEWLSDSSLTAFCTCPYYSGGGLCKHIWAAILEADKRGLAKHVPGHGRLEVIGDEGMLDDGAVDDGDEYDDYSDGFDDPFELVAGLLGKKMLGTITGGRIPPPQKKPQRPAAWRRIFTAGSRSRDGNFVDVWPAEKEKQRRAWYVINMCESSVRKWLAIDIYFQESRKNGGFGKIKPLEVSRHRFAEWENTDDGDLLKLLLGNEIEEDRYGSYYSSHFTPARSGRRFLINPALHELLLPRMAATGRLVATADGSAPDDNVAESGRVSLAWDDGPPWRFRLRASETGKGKGLKWRLSGELFRGDEIVRIDQVAQASSTGLAILRGTIARFDPSGASRWIQELGKSGSIYIPAKDRGPFLTELYGLSEVPERAFPESLAWPEAQGTPAGRLRVKKGNERERYLYATVEFLYGDRPVAAQEDWGGVVDEAAGQVLLRNREQERELLTQLAQAGLALVKGYGYSGGDVKFARSKFGHVINRLVRQGWRVEAEGKTIKSAGKFQVSVTSGIDWFDVAAQFDFDGAKVALPKLLQAAREGNQFVTLDDGSQGMLPEDWLKKYAQFAELGEVEGESLRFATSQTLILDALLAAQEQDQVAIDARFDETRRRLRSFDGVQPKQPPAAFQGELREYQKEGLGWLNFLEEFSLGGCLADDMGLGKTIQVLAMIQDRRARAGGPAIESNGSAPAANGKKGPAGAAKGLAPTLVVVPRSLVFNWIDEARRFAPELNVINYTGLGRAEMRKKFNQADLVVTTYGTLRKDILKLKDRRFDYAILDEAQAIKNPASQSAKACRLVSADHRLALTGTPVENHLGELWSLFEFLNPGMLGRSSMFTALSRQIAAGDQDALDLLGRAMGPFILRRTKDKVLTELPEKMEQTLYCELDKKQRKDYEEIRDYYRASLTQSIEKEGMAKSKMHVLEALLRLRQAACHPGLIDKKRVAEPSAKLDSLLEQLSEIVDEGHKALVFSQFTSLLSIVKKTLDKRKLTYEYLDGKTRNRKEKVERFQTDQNCPLFLISLKAGGHGLNLTAADYVFILDPWWNPAVEAQAVDRAHRIGQTRRVFSYRLIAKGTVEERILELQKSKRDLADAVISADKSLLGGLTSEDLNLLLS